MNNYIPLIEGFITCAGLIIAIGAQNAFVLKQGIMKHQVFMTALFCALVDACFITIGVGGFGTIVASSAILLSIAKWGGAAFLFWYGFRSFRAAFHSERLKVDRTVNKPSVKAALLTLAAVSFLNPHVYLDTIVLLGSISSQFSADKRPFFAIGAITSSFIWFFSLCYGARLLAPIFAKEKAWKVLDCLIGVTMWAIAVSLLF
jgi:L-lysine exporter family protein LysE/ArgO